ncbi:hypothetical protein I6N90_14235 [Paenibacillus sp. GSMTC-2017]|uniref:DUF6060 domain-containing protein n=1 Tax=Paenibacillus sp. GSMTC-2017 TaxID=2794350 RepID=UPI0018D62978|nr:hypothetical protein [Paenibacillus sp. GSMTC-2017]MBH5318960.1 hypothetical protein [Paenibacillus sp. GSMTC-2017]
MKKFSSVLITICLMFSLSTVIYASESPSSEQLNTVQKSIHQANTFHDPKTGNVILAVYEVDPDGRLVEVPMEVYKAEIQKSELEKNKLEEDLYLAQTAKYFESASQRTIINNVYPTSGTINLYYYKFIINRSYEHYDPYAAVSEPLLCNTTTHCPLAVTYTITKTHTFGANVNNTIKKDAVQAAAGYNYSSATSEQITYTYPIPPGKKAYVGFHPKMKTDTGDLQHWHRYNNTDTLLGTEYGYVTRPLKSPLGNAAGYFLLIDYTTGLPLQN